MVDDSKADDEHEPSSTRDDIGNLATARDPASQDTVVPSLRPTPVPLELPMAAYRLGPLIGKRSWGGVIGISGIGPLLDGLVHLARLRRVDISGFLKRR